MRVILTRAGRDEKGNRDSRLAPVVPAPGQHQLLNKEEEFKMRKQLFALSVVGLLFIGLSLPLTITAAAHPSVVATINGGGVADMDDGEGPSSFGMGVKLLSDGSAQGFFDCVDQITKDVVENLDLLVGQSMRALQKQISDTSKRLDALLR